MFGLCPMSGKQGLLFSLLCTILTLSFMIYSLQAPLLPREALSRNATATQYTVVMSIYEITVFIVSPTVGMYAPKFGMSNTFNTGIVVEGISTILFGSLGYFKTSARLFIGIACILRIIEAIGACCVFVSINNFVANMFKENAAAALGTLETVIQIGFVTGPVLGSALYQVGGFPLPFEAVGCTAIFLGLFAYFIFRNPSNLFWHSVPETKTDESVLSVLLIPPVSAYCWIVFTGILNNGFLISLFAVQLEQFQLTPLYIGLAFLMCSFIYGICTPIFCYVCRKLNVPELVPIAGFVFFTAGFLLIGPAPFLNMRPTLGLLLASACFISIGGGTTTSPMLVLAVMEATKARASGSTHIPMKVASLYFSSMSLGLFAGPLIGGSLYDAFGFRSATLFPVCLSLLQLAFLVAFTIWKHNFYKLRSSTERLPLLIKHRRG